jgi:ABC-type transport system involved in Fe-S cluster assembly fused permease/ATPase subunit
MWCSPQEVYVGQAVSAGLNEVRYIIFAPLGQATARRVGVQLLDHILRLDLAFHLERQTGALSRILDRAQRSVVNIFRAVVFTFIPTVVELVLVCGLLAQKVSGMVAAIVLVTFTAYVAWTVHITTQAAESRKQVNKLENLATGKAVDALLNYETVVQFNNQKLEVEQYNSLLQGYQHASVGLW